MSVLDDALQLLRANDPVKVGFIARGGGPMNDADRLQLFCPRCSCRKSGDVDEPNGRDECCTDSACLCHAQEWDVCQWHPEVIASGQARVHPEGGRSHWVPVCDRCADEFDPHDWRPLP